MEDKVMPVMPIPEVKSQLMEFLDFAEKFKKIIRSEMTELHEAKQISDPYESAEIDKLTTARAKAASEYPKIGFNQENPYFKSSYADLDAIMQSIRPILAKNGLVIEYRTVIKAEGSTELRTRILHSSGQFSETRVRIIPTKNDQQSYASALTYMKRHQTMALLNVTISEDWSDDDGERAMSEHRGGQEKGVALNTKYNPKEQLSDLITKEQLEELEYELSEFPDILTMVLDGLKIESLADMPKSKFHASAERIRKIKNARLGIK